MQSRMVDEVDGELAEVTGARKPVPAQALAKDLDALIALGRSKGMKNPEGWAAHVMTARLAKRARA